MGGLLGHISAEDRERMQLEEKLEGGIGPLGGRLDDEDWFSTVMALNKEANQLREENEQLKKEIKRLKRKK